MILKVKNRRRLSSRLTLPSTFSYSLLKFHSLTKVWWTLIFRGQKFSRQLSSVDLLTLVYKNPPLSLNNWTSESRLLPHTWDSPGRFHGLSSTATYRNAHDPHGQAWALLWLSIKELDERSNICHPTEPVTSIPRIEVQSKKETKFYFILPGMITVASAHE